ncbi:MAG: molybdenum transporter substrate-binding protein [Rhodoglobus sp.]|nr:molybdenum transporter substrate-binding protein [Rhodoglobus sp.]
MTDDSRVTLFSGLAVQKALTGEVLDSFTQDTGLELETLFDPTTEIVRLIEEGARPDVVIAVTAALRKLSDAGIVESGTITRLGRIGMGVAVGIDAPVPDISTADAFLRALTSARSVAYSQAGASGIYLRDLLARLGVLDVVAAKATVLAKGFTARAILDGRADLAIQQLPELEFVPGVAIVGPLPDELQTYTEFSVAIIGSNPGAELLRRHLASQRALQAYEQSGFDVS